MICTWSSGGGWHSSLGRVSVPWADISIRAERRGSLEIQMILWSQGEVAPHSAIIIMVYWISTPNNHNNNARPVHNGGDGPALTRTDTKTRQLDHRCQMWGPGPRVSCVPSHHSRVKKCCWDEYGARERGKRDEREIRTWSGQTVDQTTPWLWEPASGGCQELTRRGAFSRDLWRHCQDPGRDTQWSGTDDDDPGDGDDRPASLLTLL